MLVQAYLPAELAQNCYDIGRAQLVEFGQEFIVSVEAMLSYQLAEPAGTAARRFAPARVYSQRALS